MIAFTALVLFIILPFAAIVVAAVRYQDAMPLALMQAMLTYWFVAFLSGSVLFFIGCGAALVVIFIIRYNEIN